MHSNRILRAIAIDRYASGNVNGVHRHRPIDINVRPLTFRHSLRAIHEGQILRLRLRENLARRANLFAGFEYQIDYVFLATGSKAAGIVLLLRVVFGAIQGIALQWSHLIIAVAAITILYGNLCAIPQRNLKRLLGYSSISNAGYLLLGFAAMNAAGASAILYYIAGYVFTVLAAFTVISLVTRQTDSEDISVLSGLNQRAPFLAFIMTLSMVSLAGIPPLAGFFGKFLLLKAVVEKGASDPAYYALVAVTIVGVVISLYYYFGVVQAIYWSKDSGNLPPVPVSISAKAILAICAAGMLYLGLMPEAPIKQTDHVAQLFRIPASASIQKEARQH